MFKIKWRCLFLFSLLLCPEARAASCCGGGFAAPALITGDDRAQVTASYSHSQVIDDVGSDSLWRKRASKEVGETWKFDAAHVFADSWHAGLSVPVLVRSRANQASTGLGDISSTLGYEYLPDWDYHPLRPKGLGFLQLTLPTGKSIDESDTTYQLDSRGRGYWALGLGTIFTKTHGLFDFFVNLSGHRSFAKNFQNAQASGKLEPGFGSEAGGGAGFSISDLRLGTSLTWTYEDPINVSGTTPSRGAPQRFATASVSGSYLLQRLWSATLTYSDQTRFGSPVNTSLGRGIALFLQKRWER
jgi:hypothetical protein